MAGAAGSGRQMGSPWIAWTFWAAGISLLLVEFHMAMEYWEAGIQQNMGNLLGWAPAMGMITLKVAEQSVCHWDTLGIAMRAVSLAVVGMLLLGASFATSKRADGSR